MKIQIFNGLVLLPGGIRKTDIEIENGKIKKIGKDLKEDSKAKRFYAGGNYILPGFIDMHTNGIAGFDLTNGVFDTRTGKFISKPDVYLKGLEAATGQYVKNGTTLIGFTSLEAPIDRLKKIFGLIAKHKENKNSIFKDILFGIYIEGTFMKDKEFRGAHNPKYFFKPTIKLFDELQKASKGNIKIVNVVPEWGKDALTLIEYLSSKNVICAAGHSGANGEQYRAAVEKGLTIAIHVLNGPSSSSSKPFNGAGVLEALLLSDEVFAEIIVDGYHVDKSYVMDILKRKGLDKCLAISDSMFAVKMKGVKNFEISGVKGRVSKNRKYLQIVDRGDALYGSVLTMDKAFENLVNWFMQPITGIWNELHKPCSFDEALIKASKLCSVTPAKALGVYIPSKMNADNNLSFGTGSISVGKRADLVLLGIKNHRDKISIKVKNTIVNGKVVY